jgi:hypothetical protein
MLKTPGPLTQDQKTIVTQVHTLLTSFLNSLDITPDVTENRTQLSTFRHDLDITHEHDVKLMSDKQTLQDQLSASQNANALFNGQLDDARRTISTLEKRPEPTQTKDHHTCTHEHALAEDLDREIDIQEEVNAKLCSELDAERAVSCALARNTNPSPVTTATAPVPAPQKISDPDKYGGDRNKLRSFLVQLRLKAATFPTTQDKLRFAVNSLKHDAMEQASPYVKDDTVELPDLGALIQILENAFGNPNRILNAERKLNTIQQGNRDFSSYYAEFSKYAAEVSLNEGAKLAALPATQQPPPYCQPGTGQPFWQRSENRNTCRLLVTNNPSGQYLDSPLSEQHDYSRWHSSGSYRPLCQP